MIQTAIRFGLGVAAMAAGTATQWFWELVERGQTVGPATAEFAGAIDRAVTIEAPATIGAALGTAIDAGLRAGDRTRRVGTETVDEVIRFLVGVLHRAGIPERSEIELIARRLDALAATLDQIAADAGRLRVEREDASMGAEVAHRVAGFHPVQRRGRAR
jgi:hypothetical protein